MAKTLSEIMTQRGESLTSLISAPISHPVIGLVQMELFRATEMHQRMRSSHEAYAVILEELDEFWEEVRKKKEDRNLQAVGLELVQIAAMACRAYMDLNIPLPGPVVPPT